MGLTPLNHHDILGHGPENARLRTFNLCHGMQGITTLETREHSCASGEGLCTAHVARQKPIHRVAILASLSGGQASSGPRPVITRPFFHTVIVS